MATRPIPVPDPGVEFSYELGPFTLPALNAGGTAVAVTQILNTQSTQVNNFRFRAELKTQVSTFPFAALLKDGGRSQRAFSNQQVHRDNSWGTAQNQLPFLTPYTFDHNSTIQVDLTDLGGGYGTAGVTNASPNVTSASGTGFVTDGSWVNKTINIGGVLYVISSVTDSMHLVLTANYLGATNAGTVYAVSNSIRLCLIGVNLGERP
jgi:hypothetical protein